MGQWHKSQAVVATTQTAKLLQSISLEELWNRFSSAAKLIMTVKYVFVPKGIAIMWYGMETNAWNGDW